MHYWCYAALCQSWGTAGATTAWLVAFKMSCGGARALSQRPRLALSSSLVSLTSEEALPSFTTGFLSFPGRHGLQTSPLISMPRVV
ncbi:hypothetical protein V5799_003919 [Amblyomma americanum]|uniref:Uncharacterized protein n=1 Tax=Amblyomma americanum TaxID=6943 RepID=A0AAQ4D7L0_AMBAM